MGRSNLSNQTGTPQLCTRCASGRVLRLFGHLLSFLLLGCSEIGAAHPLQRQAGLEQSSIFDAPTFPTLHIKQSTTAYLKYPLSTWHINYALDNTSQQLEYEVRAPNSFSTDTCEIPKVMLTLGNTSQTVPFDDVEQLHWISHCSRESIDSNPDLVSAQALVYRMMDALGLITPRIRQIIATYSAGCQSSQSPPYPALVVEDIQATAKRLNLRVASREDLDAGPGEWDYLRDEGAAPELDQLDWTQWMVARLLMVLVGDFDYDRNFTFKNQFWLMDAEGTMAPVPFDFDSSEIVTRYALAGDALDERRASMVRRIQQLRALQPTMTKACRRTAVCEAALIKALSAVRAARGSLEALIYSHPLSPTRKEVALSFLRVFMEVTQPEEVFTPLLLRRAAVYPTPDANEDVAWAYPKEIIALGAPLDQQSGRTRVDIRDYEGAVTGWFDDQDLYLPDALPTLDHRSAVTPEPTTDPIASP